MELRAAPRDGLMDGKVDREEETEERFSVFLEVLYVCVCVTLCVHVATHCISSHRTIQYIFHFHFLPQANLSTVSMV